MYTCGLVPAFSWDKIHPRKETDMTFKQLQYIVEIYNCGSMNRAAQKLYVSQTAISSSIKMLEDELGVKLFQRTTHGIKYTDEGIRFVSYASSLLSEKERIESMYTSGGTDQNKLSFAISSQRFLFVQDAVLRLSYNSGDAGFHITYRETNLQQVIDDVKSTRSDIGVISITRYAEAFLLHQLDLAHLIFHPLSKVYPRIFCRSGHPLTEKTLIHEEDLKDFPYLYYELPPGTPADFSEEYQMMSLKMPDRSFCTDSSAFACHAFLQSDAYTIGTGLPFAHARDMDQLVSIPFAGADPIRIGWIDHKNSRESEITRLFTESLNEAIHDSMEEQRKKEVR